MNRFCWTFLVWAMIAPVEAFCADAVPLTEAQEARVQAIDGQVLSPFCPGRLLQDCPSSAAKELRDDIRRRVAGGASDEEVLESIYATYGEEFRAAPSAEGVGLLAWIAPGVFSLLGGVILLVWIRTRQSNGEDILTSDETAKLDPELEEVVERELRKI